MLFFSTERLAKNFCAAWGIGYLAQTPGDGLLIEHETLQTSSRGMAEGASRLEPTVHGPAFAIERAVLSESGRR